MMYSRIRTGDITSERHGSVIMFPLQTPSYVTG